MIYVVDASVAVKWFVREELRDEAMRLLDDVSRLHAPDWIVLEVAHAASKKWRDGEIDADQAQAMAATLPDFIARLHGSVALTTRALAIAMALPHPVYDCLYIACAEANDGVVVTADKRLCQAVRQTAFAGLVRHLEDAPP